MTDPDAAKPALRPVHCSEERPVASAEVLRQAVIDAQAVLAKYLEPGGIDADEAIDHLLAILDDDKVVKAVSI